MILNEIVPLVATALAGVGTLMFVLWLVHFPLRNAAIVDAGWAGGLAITSIVYASLGDGYTPRVVLIATMAVFWGGRLSLFLLMTRVIGVEEDGRYVQLRKDWKTNVSLKLLLFFEFQALLCIVLSGPFLFPAVNQSQQITSFEIVGVALWAIALIGEAAADAQLHRFKGDPANRGRVCRVGLWRYSRHPNYFFEWLIWVGFALFALGSPFGWIGLASPALILFFLFRVTGIPATEAQALRSKGDAYRRYQETTSAFVPWFSSQEKS